MTTTQDPIAHAARLLRETAEELRQAHAYNNIEGWENETDAKAAYDEHLAAAQALEGWEAAVGAGGVQPLRSVQEGCKLVPLEPTPEMLAALMSPGEAEALASSPSETFALMLMDRAGIRERYSAMLEAAPKQKPSQDTMYLLRRLLSNQHTLTGPEFRAELEKIVGEAYQQEAQEPTEIPEEIERMAADRYKVVPSHESMFHRWAVVAGTGTQQLYLGREVECQNMARKFAGAFLDGAFVALQQAAPQPAPAPLSEREDIAMIDAAMVEMANIVPPLKRSECARLIRAALAAQGGE